MQNVDRPADIEPLAEPAGTSRARVQLQTLCRVLRAQRVLCRGGSGRAENGGSVNRAFVPPMLLVEVAETSFRYDRGVKLPLYARAGIPEVWIVDFTADVVDVYREPRASGYATSQRVRRGGSVPPASFPDIALSADEILLEP